ncbi:MAG: hypothetical protein ACRENH_08425 [Gemmatimonadaceae bacterium]
MSDSARTPQVGDAIQLRGLERVIVRTDVTQNKVYFANPATHPASQHGSREGACAMSELQRMTSPNGVTWFLPGTSDQKASRAGAIELSPAVFEINSTNGSGG